MPKADLFGFPRRMPHCTIIPAFVLERIAANATGATAMAAINSLTATAALMGNRQVLSQPDVLRMLAQAPGVATPGKNRVVHDAKNSQRLPGAVALREGAVPGGNSAVDEAYAGAGATYDLFSECFGRNSLDGRGMRLVSSAHYGRQFVNAFWNGRQMVYGDGDGVLFSRFTAALDVCGHELAHGLTQWTAGLVYEGESGAVNEHFSDVFGVLVRHREKNAEAKTADWTIGKELFLNRPGARGIRDMLHPGTAYDDPILGKDNQPDHMDRYVTTEADNGGVHINSAIGNRAFATAAAAAGGKAWETVGPVWFRALTQSLRSKSGFHDLAAATSLAAVDLGGRSGTLHDAVRAGWDAVGVRL